MTFQWGIATVLFRLVDLLLIQPRQVTTGPVTEEMSSAPSALPAPRVLAPDFKPLGFRMSGSTHGATSLMSYCW